MGLDIGYFGEKDSDQMKFIQADREYFEELAKTIEHQADFLLAFYRKLYPDWDNITQMEGWPSISEDLSKFMFRLARDIDQRLHPEVYPGGLWMNKGPSIDRNLADDEIDLSTAKIEYATEEVRK